MIAMAQDRLEQNRSLSGVFEQERRRLLAFIRKRVPDDIDAEDLLQDVFYELVEAYRLMKPIAHAGAWMMQVAKNRITDLFRRSAKREFEDTGQRMLEELLPSPEGGPDAVFAREVLLEEIVAALTNCPPASARCSWGTRSKGGALPRYRRRPGLASTHCSRESITRSGG
jgi:RNA polymerase sigma factor (sigma-70 family)